MTESPATNAQIDGPRGLDRRVRTLPVVAIVSVAVTVSVIVAADRVGRSGRTASVSTRVVRHSGEPAAVRDQDHYVPGSPPAVAEHFLRASMRFRYDEARALSTGALREQAARELAGVGGFNAAQMEEYRRTRVHVDAASFDLEHIEMGELPPGPSGLPRKRVRGEVHVHAEYEGTLVDNRRWQVFVLERVDGAWRVVERSWDSAAPMSSRP